MANTGYTLGIDLGAQSCGWAAVRSDDEDPILGMGVRIFPAGVEDGLEKGTEVSRAVQRRLARQARRQTERRSRRRIKIYRLLQRAGLLPEGEIENRHNDLAALDKRLRQTDSNSELLPYRLRADALDRRLEPHELGRAFYHLAQRRGFLSSRKAAASEDAEKEKSEVKRSISDLSQAIEASESRTLGEYFARSDPHQKRIRERWTSRRMYEEEFDRICGSQQQHHPQILSERFIKELREALFDQRPLKSQRHTIGDCELEPGQKRAAKALLLTQRFRMLQTVNNLRVLDKRTYGECDLSDDERQNLLDALECEGDRTFVQIRRLLQLPRTVKFNLETGGEKKLNGNRTASSLLRAFGERWSDFSPEEQDGIVDELIAFSSDSSDDRAACRAVKAWGCSQEEAVAVSEVRLEDGHGSLSKRAMRKLTPLLENRMSFAEARRKEYPEQFQAHSPKDSLPPIRKAAAGLRNPAVERAVTELRKVVNAVIRRHGKPARIHIETARTLKQPRKIRVAQSKRMRDNQSARQNAVAEILKDRPNSRVSRSDKEKYILAVECNWQCPYTGERINMNSLFGPEPRFEIEHIIPYSRCLDDSFLNKTLCAADHNRHVKGNRTPGEAYGYDTELYKAILQRVRAFKSNALLAKLKRFEQREVNTEEFLKRQLNDTRYASRLGADFLGELYGGRVDTDSKQRIFPITGQITAHLRNAWDLNSILNDGDSANGGAAPKFRGDHRHHAVDALVVALTDMAHVKQLSERSERAWNNGSRGRGLESPWNDFVVTVRRKVDAIAVSHRVDRRANGQLHKETLYGPERPAPDGSERRVRHIRRALSEIGKTETIVDPAVRGAVRQKLAELGGSPKTVFQKEENLPVLSARDGRKIKIRKARVRETVHADNIGQGARLRRVALRSNHHLEIFAVLDNNGKEKKWEGRLVTTYEAMRRKRGKQPLVNRGHRADAKFKFSLSGGDTIRLDDPKHGAGLYVVRIISQKAEQNGYQPAPTIDYVRHTEARLKKDILASGDWFRKTVNTIRQARCQKMMVSPIGEMAAAND